LLEDFEQNFDVNFGGNGVAMKGGRLEPILIDCGEGALIEAIAPRFNDVDVCRNAVRWDDESYKDDGCSVLMEWLERKSFGLDAKYELRR
jgi:hypothetical protein